MTSTAIDRRTPARRGPQWLRATRWMLRGLLFMMLVGWAIAIVLVTVVLAIVSRYVDIETSGFAFSHQGMLWFPFSIAIVLSLMYIPVHVASGMTRRSLAVALIVATTLTGLANTIFSMIMLLIERAIYDWLGWFQGHTDGNGVDLFAHGIGVYALGLALLFVGGMLSGALVGVSYYRFSGWATFLLPLTLIPVIGTGLVGLSDTTQWAPWDITILGPWQNGTLFGVLILAATCVALALLLRRIPINTRKA